MVVYCIINGCKNNDNNKETDSRKVLFHVFSSNPMLKARWRKVIGRSDWEPSDNAGICNNHFNAFRLNSSFDGSLVEVCRICLATDDDVSLYSLQYGKLKQYMDKFLPMINDSCLPQFVCFECAVHLRKCYNMLKKSETSQAILFEIFLQNGEITKSLVKKLNRENLELKSPLEPHSVTPTYVFDYQFNYENNLSDLINIEYTHDVKENNELNTKSESDSVPIYDSDDNDENLGQDPDCVKKSVIDNLSCDDNEKDIENDKNTTIFSMDDEKDSTVLSEESSDGIPSSVDENNKINLRNRKKRGQESDVKSKMMTTQLSKHSTESEANGEETKDKCFNVVNLTTLQEKIDVWNKAMENPHWMKTNTKTDDIFKCEDCSKLFANRKSYEQHRAFHDPSYGTAECPVCKIRNKNEKMLRKHLEGHSKKYNCMLCPKSFLSQSSADKHYWRHVGRVYKCGRCSYTTRHASTLSGHVQRTHSHAFACELCGRACVNRAGLQRHYDLQHPGESPAPESGEMFSCEECNLKFTSENALRVHLLTSVQHRDATMANSALQNTCKLCGASFPTNYKLKIHKKSVHRDRPRDKTRDRPRDKPRYQHQSSGGDKCPLKCEYCDETLHSRRGYYFHMRRKHPGHKYQPNVKVICATCGKTFQTKTVLRHHELRHNSPRERCEQCGKMFYDKIGLARHHARIHSKKQPYGCNVCGRMFYDKFALTGHQARLHSNERPYNCKVCGRAFNAKSNLARHILTEAILRIHELRHSNPRERCEQCGKMFYDEIVLAAHHARVHTKEQPYICNECGRAFNQKSNLYRHMLIHTDVTPYECSHCGKQLKHEANLKLHIRTVHQRKYYPSELKKRTRKRTEDKKPSTPQHAGSKSSATEPASKLRSVKSSNKAFLPDNAKTRVLVVTSRVMK